MAKRFYVSDYLNSYKEFYRDGLKSLYKPLPTKYQPAEGNKMLFTAKLKKSYDLICNAENNDKKISIFSIFSFLNPFFLTKLRLLFIPFSSDHSTGGLILSYIGLYCTFFVISIATNLLMSWAIETFFFRISPDKNCVDIDRGMRFIRWLHKIVYGIITFVAGVVFLVAMVFFYT